MMDNGAPCYRCEERHSGCHSSCERYKEFSQKRAEELSMIRKKKADEAMVTAVLINSIKKKDLIFLLEKQ